MAHLAQLPLDVLYGPLNRALPQETVKNLQLVSKLFYALFNGQEFWQQRRYLSCKYWLQDKLPYLRDCSKEGYDKLSCRYGDYLAGLLFPHHGLRISGQYLLTWEEKKKWVNIRIHDLHTGRRLWYLVNYWIRWMDECVFDSQYVAFRGWGPEPQIIVEEGKHHLAYYLIRLYDWRKNEKIDHYEDTPTCVTATRNLLALQTHELIYACKETIFSVDLTSFQKSVVLKSETLVSSLYVHENYLFYISEGWKFWSWDRKAKCPLRQLWLETRHPEGHIAYLPLYSSFRLRNAERDLICVWGERGYGIGMMKEGIVIGNLPRALATTECLDVALFEDKLLFACLMMKQSWTALKMAVCSFITPTFLQIDTEWIIDSQQALGSFNEGRSKVLFFKIRGTRLIYELETRKLETLQDPQLHLFSWNCLTGEREINLERVNGKLTGSIRNYDEAGSELQFT